MGNLPKMTPFLYHRGVAETNGVITTALLARQRERGTFYLIPPRRCVCVILPPPRRRVGKPVGIKNPPKPRLRPVSTMNYYNEVLGESDGLKDRHHFGVEDHRHPHLRKKPLI
jgi:hypothetical protein